MSRSKHESGTGSQNPGTRPTRRLDSNGPHLSVLRSGSLGQGKDFTLDPHVALTETVLPRLLSDRYVLTRLIQTGGMGLVYEAYDHLLDRLVAIKMLRTDRVDHQSVLDDFVKEARMMAFLPHPGVTPIYETGTCENGKPFHVMKLVDGITLREMLDAGRSETAELLQVFTDVCQTIAFAHSRGVIHLDLKPSNIMVGAFGEANVMDWGLARNFSPKGVPFDSRESDIIGSDATVNPPNEEPDNTPYVRIENAITRQPVVNGTPEYMSPEQARGSTLDARADVFSLGGILCEILSGHAPYEGTSLGQVYFSAVRGKTSPSVERLQTCGLDEALVRLAINCLQIEVADRPADANVLAHVMMAHQASTLRSVQSDMNRFFELSPDMFCIADQNGFFVRINDNFTRVLGHPKEHLMSQPFLAFVHEDDRDSTIEQIACLNRGVKVVRFRNRYSTTDGTYKTFEWTANAIEGEHLVFAVARDVT